jgi:hypothetical protein
MSGGSAVAARLAPCASRSAPRSRRRCRKLVDRSRAPKGPFVVFTFDPRRSRRRSVTPALGADGAGGCRAASSARAHVRSAAAAPALPNLSRTPSRFSRAIKRWPLNPPDLRPASATQRMLGSILEGLWRRRGARRRAIAAGRLLPRASPRAQAAGRVPRDRDRGPDLRPSSTTGHSGSWTSWPMNRPAAQPRHFRTLLAGARSA